MAVESRSTQEGSPPVALPRLPLPKDDTEETVPGGDLHQQAIMEAYGMLVDYAAVLGGGMPAWYVSSQVIVTIGPPLVNFVWRHRPDLFVIPDYATMPREAYDTRKDGPAPPFVLDVTGGVTRHNDIEVKPGWYDRAGVQEYVVFDPTQKVPGTAVRAWHRAAQGWAEWMPWRRADGVEVWASRVLGLEVRVEGALVRFDHPQRGPLPLRRELQGHLAEEQRQRLALEDELRRLRGDISR